MNLKSHPAAQAILIGLLVMGGLLVRASQEPQPPESYPGQATHGEPPKDWFCQRPDMDKVDLDHACTCQRMVLREMLGGKCDMNNDGTPHVIEDQKCKVWCHMQHCKCPIMACDT